MKHLVMLASFIFITSIAFFFTHNEKINSYFEQTQHYNISMGKNNNKIKLGGEEAVKVKLDLDQVVILPNKVMGHFARGNGFKIN